MFVGGGGDSFLPGTCLNAMKRFYFIFLPVVLVFLYSIPGVFCLSGGGGIASSSFKKKLLLLLSGTPINILNILYIFCTCTRYSYIVYPECFVCRGGGG